MYNGIGLQTARGSGTNGYVQRNLSFVRVQKPKVDYKTEDEIRRFESEYLRPPNQEILDHHRKRKIEVRCLELEEKLEKQGLSEEEIQTKINEYRKELIDKMQKASENRQEFILEILNEKNFKETHQLAELSRNRNEKLKSALGISDDFVAGSSVDIIYKAKEQQANKEKAQNKDKSQSTENQELKDQQQNQAVQLKSFVDKIKKEDSDDSEDSSEDSESSSSSASDSSSSDSSDSSSSDSSSSESSDDDDDSSSSDAEDRHRKQEYSRRKHHNGENEKHSQKLIKEHDKSRRHKLDSPKHSSRKHKSRDSDYDSDQEAPTHKSKSHSSSRRHHDHSSSSKRDNRKRSSKSPKQKRRYDFDDRKKSSSDRKHSDYYNKKRKRNDTESESDSSSNDNRNHHHSKRSSSHKKHHSRSRSPSIPRRQGSPSFLEKRRITSARKRPVPYKRGSGMSVSPISSTPSTNASSTPSIMASFQNTSSLAFDSPIQYRNI